MNFSVTRLSGKRLTNDFCRLVITFANGLDPDQGKQASDLSFIRNNEMWNGVFEDSAIQDQFSHSFLIWSQ